MRPRHQAQSLADKVVACGGTPILFPTLEIVTRAVPPEELLHWLQIIPQTSFVIVTSPNAVYNAPMPLLESIRNAGQLRLVTMGKATTQALVAQDISVFYTAPLGSSSEHLLEAAFLAVDSVRGKRVLLLTGMGGRTLIAEVLVQRGALVESSFVYTTRQPDVAAPQFSEGPHLFVATSVRALENAFFLLPQERHAWCLSQPLVVASSRIAQRAHGLGFERIETALGAQDEAIVEMLCRVVA